ncbi:QWxxN domain [Enterococcus mundtii]|uniref:Uncharacterized protein n=1 Tax=Enterococcus mundtii TaxID=53346 RepID=A0ABQ0VDI4_ENTMU|nr:QWxxN domain [Enterococcus mundtii]GEN17869.1 hypothetical protein LAC02_11500 [Ligilactobacillus acidipiscis]AUB53879.1 hypothetical protein EM4838_13195 [Enterococcus mundtii]MZZ59153.1 QWxxN domain [Enterococcus mundtii]MZZ62151.1 QWxxN domain [Enterococcus mundtii]MZZ69231.1 QWxxN domain [Enterococcus mundtii]
MPGEDFNRRIGEFYNEFNMKDDPKERQNTMYDIASRLGQTPTDLLTPAGFLFIWSVLAGLRMPEDRPDQQRAVQDSGAVLEVDTHVEIQQIGNQVRMPALKSSSTFNPQKITPPLPTNTTQIKQNKLEVVSPLSDLADAAHQFSIDVHKLAYGISELIDCSTSEQAFHKKEYGLWENKNHTQIHFKTVCQNAIAASQTLNETRSNTTRSLQQFSFKKSTDANDPQQFNASNAAEKLKNFFQKTFEEKYQKNGTTTDVPVPENVTLSVTSFWNGLNEVFSSFFYQQEQIIDSLNHTDEKYNMLGHFTELLIQTFSSDPKTQEKSSDPLGKDNRKYERQHILKQQLLASDSKRQAAHGTEVSITAKLVALAKDFSEVFDRFVKRYDYLQTRIGAEAATIPTQSMDAPPLIETTNPTLIGLKSSEALSEATHEKINKIMLAYMENKPSPVPVNEPFTPFWYDQEVFGQRSETDKANERIRQAVCEQRSELCAIKDKPYNEFFLALQSWANRGASNHELLEKRQQLAKIILSAYGLSVVQLSAIRAINIFFQWETNNVFKPYTFTETKNIEINPIQKHNETVTENDLTNNLFIPVSASDYSMVLQITEAISQDIQPFDQSELLPVFHFDEPLFQQKNQTTDVNQILKSFFIGTGVVSQIDTDLELIKVVQNWAGRNWKNDQTIQSERAQYLAYLIHKGYGIENSRLGDFLSDIQLQAIYKQWKTNTLLAGYLYKEKTKQTIQYDLSPAETASILQVQKYLKENNQIYEDFILDRPDSIPKQTLIVPIYYHKQIFDMRENTQKANGEVGKFLYKEQMYFTTATPRQLVLLLQKWIFAGLQYEEICKRQNIAANMIVRAYGGAAVPLTDAESRAIVLQWENNNAQIGYTYKKGQDNRLGIDIEEIKKNQEQEHEEEVKKKIERFFLENDFKPTTQTNSQPKEVLHTTVDRIKLEKEKQRVAKFLTEKGVDCETTDADAFAKIVSSWVLLEGANQEVIDMVKMKQIAQVILGEEVDGVISNKGAEITFTNWLWDMIESNHLVLPTTTPSAIVDEKAESIPAVTINKWLDKKIMTQVETFFRQKGMLSTTQVSKEDVLSAMGEWFGQTGMDGRVSSEKVQAIAKVILKELKLYGGKPEEMISDRDAELTVMKWTVENVLGTTIEGYAAKKIIDSSDPSTFTIGQLRKSFSVEELIKADLINIPPKSATQQVDQKTGRQNNITKLWIMFMNRALPNYFLKSSEVGDDVLIADYDSLMQMTGSRILKDLGYLEKFNQTEIKSVGELFFESFRDKGIDTVEEISHLLVPATLAIAQLDPDILRGPIAKGDYQQVALSTFVNYLQRGYFELIKKQEMVNDLVLSYQTAVINWRQQSALVDEVLEECKKLGITVSLAGGQVYLAGGNPCPGPWIPPDINEWYMRLTKAVSESFYSLDQFLIRLAVDSFHKDELNFIFSSESRIYEAQAVLSHKARHSASGPGTSGFPPVFLAKEVEVETLLTLDETDLFVVILGGEERCYALKRLEKDGGYKLYRVDKDPMSYLRYGLFNRQDLWKNEFRKYGDKVLIRDKPYIFKLESNQNKLLLKGNAQEAFINHISGKHRDKVYRQLYDSGRETTMVTKIWDVFKHLIPFYDCVVGSMNKDIGEAVPSCMLDAVSLIPVLGQVTALNTRFVFGMARTIMKQGVAGIVRHSTRFLPRTSELRSIVVSAIRYADPGIEFLNDSSQALFKGLIRLKNQAFIRKELKEVVAKLEKFGIETHDWAKSYTQATLPNNGPEIRVKRVQDHLYVPVSDLKKGTVYGNHFTLRGTKLRLFEGPAVFFRRHKYLVNRISRKIPNRDVAVKELNLNPKAYGEATTLTVTGERDFRQTFIEMNKKLVPVRISTIENHGVRYDIHDRGAIYPVNFNGIEWYFEAETSPTVSLAVREKVGKELSQYESLLTPTTLSPPDENGLMWNSAGRSYIRIQEQYLPLVLLDKETNRYHLVKKNILAPMTVLRLDTNNGAFRFETPLEKANEKYPGTVQYNSPNSPQEGMSKKEDVGSARGKTVAQRNENSLYPPYNTLPESPNRWWGWYGMLNAIEYSPMQGISRLEDELVPIKPLDHFVPEPQRIVYIDEEKAQKSISDEIAKVLSLKPDDQFRVFSGLDISMVPESLRPFIEKLPQEFKNAIENFRIVKDVCLELLKVDKIAETAEGQYLINFLDVPPSVQQEKILKESVKRLLSIATKGEQFLRQSADWGFENIWIVSTDFVLDEKTHAYYSVSNDNPKAYAFVLKEDAECRIIIVADAFHKRPEILPGIQIAAPPEITITHETTHIVSGTYDVVKYGLTLTGFLPSGQNVKDDFLTRYSGFFEHPNFDQFVTGVAKQQNAPRLSKKTVVKAFQTDAMLFTNFKLTDAQLLATIMRDFANQNEFYNQPRVKRETKEEGLGDGKLFTVLAMMQTGNFFVLEQTKDLEKKQDLSEMMPTGSTQIRDEVADFARIISHGKKINKETNATATYQKSNDDFSVIPPDKNVERKQVVPKMPTEASAQKRDKAADFARIMRGDEDKNESHDHPRVKRETKEESGDGKLFPVATTMKTGDFLVIEQDKRLEKKQVVPKMSTEVSAQTRDGAVDFAKIISHGKKVSKETNATITYQQSIVKGKQVSL